jgi:hypothetical protein
MLLPTNIVAINLEGFSVILVRILDVKPSCFFSISRKILLEETKAISIPEKNAQRSKHSMITTISI